MRSYFNTNELAGSELATAEARAESQEQLVERIFRQSRSRMLTPEDVLNHMPEHTPLTSARRAITNLTARGVLEKLDEFERGRYGAKIHYWSLVRGEPEQMAVFKEARKP